MAKRDKWLRYTNIDVLSSDGMLGLPIELLGLWGKKFGRDESRTLQVVQNSGLHWEKKSHTDKKN